MARSMAFFSSVKAGKKRNITAIGMEMHWGIWRKSMELKMAPTSEVLMKKLPAR